MTLRTSRIAALAVAGGLAACASARIPPEPGAITYEITSQGPFCFAGCEVLKFTALPSGEVRIERRWTNGRRTRRTDRRVLRVDPDQFAAFRTRLAPLRPSGALLRNGHGTCATFTDDLPEVEVTWSGAGGEDRLRFGFGCDPDRSVSAREALRAAPALLGIRSPL